jgi:hypothetical protein
MAGIVICSTSFLALARNQARSNGFADLPLAVVDHPLGGIGEAAVRQRLEQALPQVLQQLRDLHSA